MLKAQTDDNDLQLLSKWRWVLMGFAALWVYMIHTHYFLFDGVPLLDEAEKALKKIGLVGVDMFLLLSGLSMTYAIDEKSPYTFYKRRIQRLIFPYLAMAIVIAIIDKWDFVTFIFNILPVNMFRINVFSYLWYIQVCFFFYALFPLYWFFFLKCKNKHAFFALTIAAWFIIFYLIKAFVREDLFIFFNRIPVFITGIYLGWLSKNKKVKFGLIGWLAVVALFFVGIIFSRITAFECIDLIFPQSECLWANYPLAIALCFLVAGFFEWLSKAKKLEGFTHILTAVYSFFGMLSLEFYCVQEWTYLQLIKFVRFSPLLNNLIDFAVILAFAVLLCLLKKGVFALCKLLKNKTKKRDKNAS